MFEIGDADPLPAGEVRGLLGPARKTHGLWTVRDGTLLLAAFDPVPSTAGARRRPHGGTCSSRPTICLNFRPRCCRGCRGRAVCTCTTSNCSPTRIEGPFAVLTLSPGTGGGARLSWSIGYQVNDTRHVFDPAEAVTVAYRDKAAEAAL